MARRNLSLAVTLLFSINGCNLTGVCRRGHITSTTNLSLRHVSRHPKNHMHAHFHEYNKGGVKNYAIIITKNNTIEGDLSRHSSHFWYVSCFYMRHCWHCALFWTQSYWCTAIMGPAINWWQLWVMNKIVWDYWLLAMHWLAEPVTKSLTTVQIKNNILELSKILR